eukprot:CAMPEP_0119024436 /NCGR_PEP_ID=MMETSP1176-20130426/31892_1 /TAXON_ID=265551 /ORGANISM="Synedropsis recta cf, Strain CCMP1620" /LENGTH=340 /DNA_ID=CAMNT_0006979739 /DNA_START=1 /DNA_END=1026 /DNA_ORIENTATION=+
MPLILFSWLPTVVISFSPVTISNSRSVPITTSSSSRLNMGVSTDLLPHMSKCVSEALGRKVELASASGGGYAGGGGATTSAVFDVATSQKFFVKATTGVATTMLQAEYEGVKEMATTQTIRVPTPIAYGNEGRKAYVVFEYLNFCGAGGSNFDLGVQLAKMHRCTSPKNQYGFHIDNTIGATPQPNMPWMDDWADFWDVHRLGHMLTLTNDAGYGSDEISALRLKTRELLSQHAVVPSLMHGDLWGGNKSFAKEEDGTIVPVIFDPATYYGDREADLAMTYLFGGFGSDFYEGYESEWPLAEGHEKRRTIYNLYHILNHEVLFGGYMGQARSMISQILRF